MFGVQFYPTPQAVVDRMLDGIDFQRVQFALEPSAGKGDIADGIKRRSKTAQIDCVEIDRDLQAVLRERGYRVGGDDFLRYDTHTRYDLIAMNPPFADGEQHLLRALELMKNGGQIVCLLNAETLRSLHTNARKDLANKLDSLGASVEYLQGAFAGAERKTSVEVALIRVDIPLAEDRDVLRNLKEEFAQHREYTENDAQLAENDVFIELVRQYDFECNAGTKIIDEYHAMRRYLPQHSNKKNMISIEIHAEIEEEIDPVNLYIRELRHKYWAALFGLKQMQGLLTREVREQYTAQLTKFRAYDFTMSNILQVKIDLSNTLVGSIEDAIIKVFDTLTYEYSMDKNTNIHYYNGWKTNSACKINPKIILAFYGLYDSRWGGSWSAYKATDTLAEIEKIMNYLDSGRTDGVNCDQIIRDTFQSSGNSYAGEKIRCKFFDVSFKKKGTVHLWFTDIELLKKLNIFGAKKKNWLPPSYGKKTYADMEQNEQKTVDAFEGKSEYEKTMQCPAYYIGGVDMLTLNAGKEGNHGKDRTA